MTDREFWLAIRQALFSLADAIEKKHLSSMITTADIRKLYKDATKPERS